MDSTYEEQALFSKDVIVKDEVMDPEDARDGHAVQLGPSDDPLFQYEEKPDRQVLDNLMDLPKEELGGTRLAPGKDVKEEMDDAIVVKEEVDDGPPFGSGGYSARKKSEYRENTASRKRNWASSSSSDHPFAKTESDNQVFTAHEFFTNQAIVKGELSEDEEEKEGDGMVQTADDKESENSDEQEKMCLVAGCSEKCDSYEDLVRHMKTHPKPLLYGQCKKQWPTPYRLRAHHRSHSGVRPFKCPTCEKSFTQASVLKTHIRQHTGDLPFECDQCERKFADSTSLKYHQTLHTGEKAFPCTLCSYRSASARNLTTHMRTHTGEKPFECTDCGQCFSQKPHLEKHMDVIHLGLKKYACLECDFKGACRWDITRHFKKMHKK